MFLGSERLVLSRLCEETVRDLAYGNSQAGQRLVDYNNGDKNVKCIIGNKMGRFSKECQCVKKQQNIGENFNQRSQQRSGEPGDSARQNKNIGKLGFMRKRHKHKFRTPACMKDQARSITNMTFMTVDSGTTERTVNDLGYPQMIRQLMTPNYNLPKELRSKPNTKNIYT